MSADTLPTGFITVPLEDAPPEAGPPRLRSVTAAELLTMSLPPRACALEPVIPLPGLAMIYAPRGAGKTFVALSIGHAVASGGTVLKWRAPAPRRVLYVDGEMPAAQLQERLARLIRGASTHPPEADFLRFLAADLAAEGLPSIARPETQRALEAELAATKAEVVILDNLSTLAAGLRENEADDWGDLQTWLLRLRRLGKSVVLVHHAGKAGQQRGTSRREDALDTVIALRRAGDYVPTQGASFECHIEKARGLAAGPAAAPFSASLIETPEGGLTWAWADLADAQRERAAEMLASGMSIRDVAEETGLSRSAVHRMKQAGAANGRA